MQYLKGINEYKGSKDIVMTIGKFDGLHKGHQKLIECVKEQCKSDMESMVFAFDMYEFRKKMGIDKQIMLDEERKTHLEGEVDYLLECPFTEAIQNMSATSFVKEILVRHFHIKVLVVGIDFRFGYHQEGNVETLEKCSKEYGFRVIAMEKAMYEGRQISSTYIREMLREGNVSIANMLLGYSYSITGKVLHGKKLGRTMGFPTVNIEPSSSKILPLSGVYACEVEYKGKMYQGIGNIGYKPTVSSERQILLEVHLFYFHEEIYGENLQVKLQKFVRREKKFANVMELKAQIEQDKENVMWFLNSERKH